MWLHYVSPWNLKCFIRVCARHSTHLAVSDVQSNVINMCKEVRGETSIDCSLRKLPDSLLTKHAPHLYDQSVLLHVTSATSYCALVMLSALSKLLCVTLRNDRPAEGVRWTSRCHCETYDSQVRLKSNSAAPPVNDIYVTCSPCLTTYGCKPMM